VLLREVVFQASKVVFQASKDVFQASKDVFQASKGAFQVSNPLNSGDLEKEAEGGGSAIVFLREVGRAQLHHHHRSHLV